MPHPERAVDGVQGGTDGATLFASLAGALVAA
jgi:phosphoribosylformylglycinamidine synthase